MQILKQIFGINEKENKLIYLVWPEWPSFNETFSNLEKWKIDWWDWKVNPEEATRAVELVNGAITKYEKLWLKDPLTEWLLQSLQKEAEKSKNELVFSNKFFNLVWLLKNQLWWQDTLEAENRRELWRDIQNGIRSAFQELVKYFWSDIEALAPFWEQLVELAKWENPLDGIDPTFLWVLWAVTEWIAWKKAQAVWGVLGKILEPFAGLVWRKQSPATTQTKQMLEEISAKAEARNDAIRERLQERRWNTHERTPQEGLKLSDRLDFNSRKVDEWTNKLKEAVDQKARHPEFSWTEASIEMALSETLNWLIVSAEMFEWEIWKLDTQFRPDIPYWLKDWFKKFSSQTRELINVVKNQKTNNTNIKAKFLLLSKKLGLLTQSTYLK